MLGMRTFLAEHGFTNGNIMKLCCHKNSNVYTEILIYTIALKIYF